MKKLEVEVRKEDGVCKLRITKQTHRGNAFHNGRKFLASNGYCLESYAVPAFEEFDVTRNVLFVKGDNKAGDNLVATIPNRHLDGVLQAIEEYNKYYERGENMSKLAKVHTRKLSDGSIQILKFENFFTDQEIKNPEVRRLYKQANPRMYRNRPDEIVVVEDSSTSWVSVGIFPQEKFSEIIKLFKNCGKNYVKIRKEVEENETKNKPFVVEI